MVPGLVVVIAMAASAIAGGAQKDAFRIVVIEGEGAVNIIQQKTAVAPVVEVRDRNNLPVSGATVTFSIGGKGATFGGGAQTVTLTTNTAGRAAVAALNPLGSGSVQIQVSAAFQGQTAIATIAQTNVLTAAEAVAAAGASGAGGSSGGAATGGAAAGGGGLSGTTIGILGAGAAAAAGGALVATGVVGGGGKTYTGSFSGQLLVSNAPCLSTRAITGTLTLELEVGDSTVSGTADIQITETEVSVAGPNCNAYPGQKSSMDANITGTAGAIAFTKRGDAPVQVVGGFSFTGALSGDVVTGTLTYANFNTATGAVLASVDMPVSLR